MPFEVKINKILNDKTILLSDFNTNLPENFSGTLNIIIDSDWKSLTNDKVEMIKNVPGLKEVVIFSNDFEAIKEIDKLLIGIDQYKKGELLNDYKFIDRSYIDISKTNYNDVIIPFALSVWVMVYNLTLMFSSTFVNILNGAGILKVQTITCFISPIVFLGCFFLLHHLGAGVYSVLVASVVANFNGIIIAPIQCFIHFFRK